MKSSILSFSGCLALAMCLTGSTYGLIQITETFDDNPVARGWIGVDNQAGSQNYGFSTGDITGSAVNSPLGAANWAGQWRGDRLLPPISMA